MKRFVNFSFILCFVLFFAFSCKDRGIVNRTPKAPSEESVFIWSTMKNYYLWEDKSSALNIRAKSGDWYALLNKYEGKNTDLFDKLLYKTDDENNKVDKWSYIIEDYKAYDQSLQQANHKSFGFHFEIIEKRGIEGIVLYVVPNGPAAKAGVKRGDIFTKINGQPLTQSNYKELLSKSECDLTITQPLPKNIHLTATSVIENPVMKTLAFDVDGIRVGYLLYNIFGINDNQNLDLNKEIQRLKDGGVKELVLDLRYNGGGSVYTASLLGSMLVKKQHLGKVFDRREYNARLTAEFTQNGDNDLLQDKFADKIYDVKTLKKQIGTINSLELDRVFILSSRLTASASELLINGLKPYMKVVLIGTETYGKYVGSTRLYDRNEKGEINPNHRWALRPIIMKFFNNEGVGNYSKGLVPDYRRDEHDVFPQYLPLGEPSEYLFKTALDIIRGKTVNPNQFSATTRSVNVKTVDNSLRYTPFNNMAYDTKVSVALENRNLK